MSKKSLTILFGVLLVIAACSKAENKPVSVITTSPPLQIQPSPTNTLVKPATATIAPSPTLLSVADDPESSTIGNQNNETQDVSGGMTSPISSNIWNSRDVPPAGVIEQISFIKSGGAGGGFGCSPSSTEPITQPIIWFGHTEKTIKAEINTEINICIEGLGDVESAIVNISGPSDFQIDYIQFIDDWSEDSDPILRIGTTPKSGDPLGIYTVDVSSKNGDASAQYEVINATTPVLWYDGYYGQNEIYREIGQKFPIYLAGFSPKSDINFHLFKGDGIEEISDQDKCRNNCKKTNLKYLTTWQQFSDGRGEIILELNSEDESSQGVYLLIISSPNAPACDMEYQSIEEYGDWGSITCDLVFKIQIGEESLPTIDNTAGTLEAFSCPGAPPTRLSPGMLAFVSLDPPMSNKLRINPGTSAQEIGKIPPGKEVVIYGGPVCKNKYVWWEVIVKGTNQSGWTVEGDLDDYWLIPSEVEP